MSASPRANRSTGRRSALFGGTFDPIHLGHLAVAHAAMKRFHLDHIYFIPCAYPPHKTSGEMLPFAHRYAMVALACAEHSRFVPSLAEAETNGGGRRVFYSVDTVRRFRREFRKPGDRLYFLMGADSFLDIRAWKNYRTFLGLCDFVVAHRPGFASEALRQVIPPQLFAKPAAGKKSSASTQKSIALRNTSVHLLDTVDSGVSATAIRRRMDRGQSIHGLVPSGVEDYIKKQALYNR